MRESRNQIRTRAAAAQLRPAGWALHTGEHFSEASLVVGHKGDATPLRVADLMRHQQRLTDLIAALASELEVAWRAADLLREVEWDGHDAVSRCPSCGATSRRVSGFAERPPRREYVHDEGCRLAAALEAQARADAE